MGKRIRAGLAGYPIDHSLSPCIHSAAYQELGLDWSYELFPCVSEIGFSQLLADMRSGKENVVALNVTTPYKQKALQLCDSPDPESEVIGGANVLALIGSDLMICHNTDGQAAVRSLCEIGFEPDGADVVICGTGPVAAAALLALVQANAATVGILSRDRDKAEQFIMNFELMYQRVFSNQLMCGDPIAKGSLIVPSSLDLADKMQDCASHRPQTQIFAIDLGNLAAVLRESTALIDATPLGMQAGDPSVVPVGFLHPDMFVLDTVYAHGETALLAGARAAGCRTIDGLAMLVEQAASSIEHWLVDLEKGHMTAPRDKMLAAAAAELKARAV